MPGTTCSTQTVSVSVTSDCLPIVVGVIVTSSDVKAVTSPSPGQYDIEVCSAPTFATFEKIGYASLSTSIDEGTQVTLTCVGKYKYSSFPKYLGTNVYGYSATFHRHCNIR